MSETENICQKSHILTLFCFSRGPSSCGLTVLKHLSFSQPSMLCYGWLLCNSRGPSSCGLTVLPRSWHWALLPPSLLPMGSDHEYDTSVWHTVHVKYIHQYIGIFISYNKNTRNTPQTNPFWQTVGIRSWYWALLPPSSYPWVLIMSIHLCAQYNP